MGHKNVSEAGAEISKIGNIDITKMLHEYTKIGRCTFNKKANTIDIEVTPAYIYQVDLDWCTTSKGVLDWIHQIHEKTWGAEVMDDFLGLLFNHISSRLWHGGA